MRSNYVLCESEGKFDNGWVFYNYLINNRTDVKAFFYQTPVFDSFWGELKKYVWLMWHIKLFKYAFTSYSIIDLKKYNPNAVSIHMGHSVPFKYAYKSLVGVFSQARIDYITFSENVSNVMELKYNMSDVSKKYLIPHPRIDLFKAKEKIIDSFRNMIGWKNGEVVITTMLTFRRNENQITSLNLLPFDIDFNKLNDALNNNGIRLVIKLHHMLDEAVSNENNYSNIVFLKNVDAIKNGFEATSIMACSDAIVSDYSSSWIDYLFLNKPIAFYIGDYDDYKSNDDGNGFVFQNPLDLMPGAMFSSGDELIKLLPHLIKNDKYFDKRKKMCRFFFGVDSLPDSACSILEKKIIN